MKKLILIATTLIALSINGQDTAKGSLYGSCPPISFGGKTGYQVKTKDTTIYLYANKIPMYGCTINDFIADKPTPKWVKTTGGRRFLADQKLEGDTLKQVWQVEFGWDKACGHSEGVYTSTEIWHIERGVKKLVSKQKSNVIYLK